MLLASASEARRSPPSPSAIRPRPSGTSRAHSCGIFRRANPDGDRRNLPGVHRFQWHHLVSWCYGNRRSATVRGGEVEVTTQPEQPPQVPAVRISCADRDYVVAAEDGPITIWRQFPA